MSSKAKHLGVAVGIPNMGMWYTDFATSYCNMMVHFMTHRVKDYDSQVMQTISARGSLLPKQRRECVLQARKLRADYLLWLDCDHTFPRYLLSELLKADKDVIGINCVTKQIPATPTARRQSLPHEAPHGMPVYSDTTSQRYEKVWRLGCGIMLVKMSVFQKTGPNIFSMNYREDVDTFQGEDWSMCEAMEQAGVDIWVDHELSLQVGHIGYLEYNHSLVGEIVREGAEDVVPSNTLST
jgi:hypothetical protein